SFNCRNRPRNQVHRIFPNKLHVPTPAKRAQSFETIHARRGVECLASDGMSMSQQAFLHPLPLGLLPSCRVDLASRWEDSFRKYCLLQVLKQAKSPVGGAISVPSGNYGFPPPHLSPKQVCWSKL